MNQAEEILAEIESELYDFKEDGKVIFGSYGKSDYEELVNRIAFVMQNNRCKHCQKLITYRAFANFECNNCGFSLLETLKNDLQKEKSVKQ